MNNNTFDTSTFTPELLLAVWEQMSDRETYWEQFGIAVEDDGEMIRLVDTRGEDEARLVVAELHPFLFTCLCTFLMELDAPTPAEVSGMRKQLGLDG